MIKRFVDLDGPVPRLFNRHVLEYNEPKRATRRRHLIRMKAKAGRISKLWFTRLSNADVEHRAVRLANNLKPCSCWMCGHQRKWHGPNWQEIKAKENSDASKD